MALKRTVTLDAPVSKRTRTLTSQVAKLRRQVNSTKPELKQLAYPITVTPLRTTPIPLILPTNVAGEEIRVSRIHVAGQVGSGAVPFGMIYSPNQGYTEIEGLVNTTNANSVDNILAYPDQTKVRVWQRKFLDTAKVPLPNFQTGTPGVFFLEKKFSIPMIVGMATSDAAAPTVKRNQIFLTTGQVPSGGNPVTIWVSLWYYDN